MGSRIEAAAGGAAITRTGERREERGSAESSV